jgi:hypothetical protein
VANAKCQTLAGLANMTQYCVFQCAMITSIVAGNGDSNGVNIIVSLALMTAW